MNINFLNYCSHTVIIKIQFETLIEIPPYRLVPVDINKSNSLMLYVRCDGTSYAKEGKYFLSIQTNYSFDNVKDGETFKITREKVRVDPEVYYERLFLIAEKSICLSESHFVIDSDKIKKKIKKSRLIKFLIISPLECLTGLFLALLAIGILLLCNWGWKIAVIYFPCAYGFLILINWLIEKILKLVFNKRLKIDDDKEELYCYLNSEQIMKYYSNPNRTPFMGEIEIN